MFEPGLVKRNTDRSHTWFAVGELHGRRTPRLEEIVQILSSVGIAEVSANIWGAKWSKLVVNCMFMAVCGILGIYDWEITRNPQLFDLSIKLGREALKVGIRHGYKLEPLFGLNAADFLQSTDEILKKNLLTIISTIGKEALNCILQDHLKERRNEVDFINGLVVSKGREVNVPTPLNKAITAVSKQIERKTLKPGLSNLPMLEKLIEATET
jgi:2-dehydropantoate 2-reductase